MKFSLCIVNDDFNDVVPIAYNRRYENLFARKEGSKDMQSLKLSAIVCLFCKS